MEWPSSTVLSSPHLSGSRVLACLILTFGRCLRPAWVLVPGKVDPLVPGAPVNPLGLRMVGRLMAVECLELEGQVQTALGVPTEGAGLVHLQDLWLGFVEVGAFVSLLWAT